MDKKSIQSSLVVFGLLGSLLMLSACSSGESTGWTKKASPWDHIRSPKENSGSYEQTAPIEVASDESQYAAEEVPVVEPEPVVEVIAEEPAIEEYPVEEPVVAGGILDVPADYYTVQLMASVDIDRVYRFADQNQLSIQYIVPTYRDGVVWHVLLLDVYPDRASAKAGKNEVEATLRTQPWIRSVGSIQKLMQ